MSKLLGKVTELHISPEYPYSSHIHTLSIFKGTVHIPIPPLPRCLPSTLPLRNLSSIVSCPPRAELLEIQWNVRKLTWSNQWEPGTLRSNFLSSALHSGISLQKQHLKTAVQDIHKLWGLKDSEKPLLWKALFFL